MTTDDKWPGHENPHQRNDALAFFGLPKEPAPEIAAAADTPAAHQPDPAQAASTSGAGAAGGSNADYEARRFLGLDGGDFPWSRFVPKS